MSRRRLRFYQFSRQHVGQPYTLGTADCLTLLLDLCEHIGISIPDSFDGVTRETYADLYASNPERAGRILLKFVCAVAQPIATNKTMTGDILFAVPRHEPNYEPFVLLHAGGDRVLGAFQDRGRVDLGPIRGYKIIRAYRLRGK